MKKISTWAGAGILILSISLAGIGLPGTSLAKDQTSEKVPGKTPPVSGHGETAVKSKKKVDGASNQVVARVNGTEITMNELIIEMNQIAPSFVKDPKQRTPEIDKKVKETALGILVFRELAVQEAVRQGIKAESSAVEESRKQFKQNLGSEDNYRKYLQKTGLTEDSMRKLLKKDILFSQITAKEIFQKAKGKDKASIESRKAQWEKSLRKKAKIEILLPELR